MMLRFSLLVIVFIFSSCNRQYNLHLPITPANALTGSGFYQQAASLKREEWELVAAQEILSGNIPSFMNRFIPIHVFIKDSPGKTINATYFVSPDYLSVGNNSDWARIPLTPMTAQRIADSLQCFLPTRKMVDDIYRQATVKLNPVPLFAYRDSSITFWHHHLMIEGQRMKRKGLIAGIKKDVVLSEKITRDSKSNRVAIYGWHKSDGKPIQPLYTGHINWYVDYSHGIRLVYRKIKIEGQWMDYTEVLKNELLKKLLCDEEFCDFVRYDY